LGKGKGRIPV
jgi:hypothetical protein